MERLTFDGNFCDIAQCRAIPCPYDNNCTQKQVWERLRQYEDTGLSPIACKEAQKIESGLSVDGYSISRMVELMVADVNGKILRLPCKPGDRVFAVGKQQIVECKVDSIYLDKRRHGVCVTFNCVAPDVHSIRRFQTRKVTSAVPENSTKLKLILTLSGKPFSRHTKRLRMLYGKCRNRR